MKLAAALMLVATMAEAQTQNRLAPSRAPSVAANNTFFVTWRDPREYAFEVGVPQGWQVSGGMVRSFTVETHSVIRATSPDGKIQIFNDDPDLHPRQIPSQLTQFAGFREGQTIQGAWGGPVLLARHVTGSQFAQQYIQARLCRQPAVITGVMDLREATARMNAIIAPYAMQQRVPAQANIGEATFACGGSVGYALANRLYTGQPGGLEGWSVYQLSGYVVSDPQQAGLAC